MLTRDTLSYPLQHLGFFLNLNKSVLQPLSGTRISRPPCKFCEFAFLTPLHKVQKVQEECREMHNRNWTSILELTKHLGLFLSTIQAVVRARLQIQNLQQLQTQSLKLKKSKPK